MRQPFSIAERLQKNDPDSLTVRVDLLIVLIDQAPILLEQAIARAPLPI